MRLRISVFFRVIRTARLQVRDLTPLFKHYRAANNPIKLIVDVEDPKVILNSEQNVGRPLLQGQARELCSRIMMVRGVQAVRSCWVLFARENEFVGGICLQDMIAVNDLERQDVEITNREAVFDSPKQSLMKIFKLLAMTEAGEKFLEDFFSNGKCVAGFF